MSLFIGPSTGIDTLDLYLSCTCLDEARGKAALLLFDVHLWIGGDFSFSFMSMWLRPRTPQSQAPCS